MLATVPERRSDGLAWRNLLSGIGAGEGGVGHGEVGWVGVWGEGGGENLGK